MIAPYISRADVSAALASLIHNTRKLDGLRHLLLVDLRLLAPDMPRSDASRDYAVRALLVDIIGTALIESRALFRLAPLDANTPLDHVRHELDEVVKIGAHELLAWSVLYYRYIRSDLGLSVEALAQRMGVSTRTITRYNDDGIDLLTMRLIEAEQTARREQHKRRLNAALPYGMPLRLFGRDVLLRATGNAVNSLSPRHILICGDVGVGKTAFAQELMRHEIDRGRLDQLVWLDRPDSVVKVRQQVEELLPESGTVALGDYLLLYRVAVVLDGIDVLTADGAELGALLRDLSAAIVILINRMRVPLDSVSTYVTLPEIDAVSTERLIAEMLSLNSDVDNTETITREVLSRVGGNPLAIRLAVGRWEQGIEWDALNGTINARLLESLDGSEQQAWRVLALFPRPVSADELRATWQIEESVLRRLERLGVAAGDNQTYGLVGAAREYARSLPPEPFLTLLEQISPPDSFEIIEYALETGFPERRAMQRTAWISAYWREGLRRGHWAVWRAILEAHFAETATVAQDLRIAYGMCLRRMSAWESAEQVFYNVVADCGRSGQFAEQAWALAEWSILSRYRGKYERAQALVDQAKRYALRTHDTALIEMLALQQAQMLIQEGRAGEAYQLLSTQAGISALALQSEAQLVLGQYAFCRVLAYQALEAADEDHAMEASLYTIIGRSYQEQGDWEGARRALTEAVVLLERLGDAFALARAQANLAAVLIPLLHYEDAGMLLRRAEQVQVQLGDPVGLSTTRHNLAILDGHIAN